MLEFSFKLQEQIGRLWVFKMWGEHSGRHRSLFFSWLVCFGSLFCCSLSSVWTTVALLKHPTPGSFWEVFISLYGATVWGTTPYVQLALSRTLVCVRLLYNSVEIPATPSCSWNGLNLSRVHVSCGSVAWVLPATQCGWTWSLMQQSLECLESVCVSVCLLASVSSVLCLIYCLNLSYSLLEL